MEQCAAWLYWSEPCPVLPTNPHSHDDDVAYIRAGTRYKRWLHYFNKY